MQVPAKTKIVCTVGPATNNVETICNLIFAGMNVARLNFSHGTHEDHAKLISNIRAAEEKAGTPIAILGDLQGPKIRTGIMENSGARLENGRQFIITNREIDKGNSKIVGTTFPGLIKDARVGKEVLLDDGYIILKINEITTDEIRTTVVKGGLLKNNKGIIIPGIESSAPSLSNKDMADLRFILEHDVDALAMSFVRTENDLLELKSAMKTLGKSIPIVSKIERSEAVSHISRIIKETDMIMVARGDLGLEMPAEEVPLVQKEIIEKCNFYGKPVIVATQMLESMIRNPRPTRAEASDVANAVLDGADAVMLSGETSVGDYPVEAVDYMKRIIVSVEKKYCTLDYEAETPREKLKDFSDALANASCVLARRTGSSAIISITGTGDTAQYISKYRPCIPILAMTDSIETMRILCFVWGVYSIHVPQIDERKDIYVNITDYIKDIDYVNEGDNVVFVAGLTSNSILPQNVLKVYQIP